MARPALAEARRSAVLLAAMACTASACSLDIGGGPPPRRARVILTSEDGTVAQVLTSLDFVIDTGGTIDAGGAIPVISGLPFEETFELLDPPRIFVRVTPPDTLTDLTVSLQILLDGELFTTQSDIIGPSGRGELQFLYRYTRPTL